MVSAAVMFMLAAAVFAAGMIAVAVGMVMMVAVHVRIKGERSRQQSCYGFVCRTLYAAVQGDAGLSQSHLRAAADAAADQRMDTLSLQKSGQRTVAAAHRIDDFRADDCAVFYFVNLELFRMAEMLKNLALFISNCNFHTCPSLSMTGCCQPVRRFIFDICQL